MAGKVNDVIAMYIYWFDEDQQNYVSIRVFEVQSEDLTEALTELAQTMPKLRAHMPSIPDHFVVLPVLTPIPSCKREFVQDMTLATLPEGRPLKARIALATLIAGHLYDGDTYFNKRGELPGAADDFEESDDE